MTGTGTQGDPYIIWDVNDLQNVQNDLGAYYELGQDIDASDTSTWNGGLGFDPIGTNWSVNPFTGDFDGKGFTIDGLFINRPAIDYVGLFAATVKTGVSGTIKNVKLTNVNITGQTLVGALIGDSYGDIDNCSSTGAVNGDGALGGLVGYLYGDATNSWSSCTVTTTGAGDEIGGFAGYTAGTTARCFASGDVVGANTGAGNNDYVGGFAGINLGSLTDCYARGDVTGYQWVGGFVGYNSAGKTIDDSYSTGIPTGTADVGGFCGENNATGVITNCFWDTTTSGTGTSDGGTGKTTANMKLRTTFDAVGWDLQAVWNLNVICNDGYPCLIDVNVCCLATQSGSVDQSVVGDKVALEYIRNVEIQFGGRFYIDKSGNARYETRYTRHV
jgi:hypothetical protein